MSSVTKKELVDMVADLCHSTNKKQIHEVIDAFTTAVTTALADGKEVRLLNFGVFKPVERKGHIGRNPKTGETITIQPTRRPKFVAGKQFKNALNGDK